MRIENDRQESTFGKNRPVEDRLNKKKKGKGLYWLGMLGCLAALMVIMFAGTALYAWVEEGIAETNQLAEEVMGNVAEDPEAVQETVTYTQEELDAKVAEAVEAAKLEAYSKENERILGGIKEQLENGATVVETLRSYYPEHLVLASDGKFCFVPIQDNLKKNTFIQENLIPVEGTNQLQYMQDGQVVSHKGIDVSQHQGKIDWEKVAGDGVEFAFIRVGFRGYGTGKLVEDEQFENNIKGALANGIKVGVYFFSQAITQEEVLEEAEFVLDKIAPYRVECPIVFDVEKVADKDGRMNLISVEERTNITLSFCQTIEAAGYQPMIYHNMEMAGLLLDLETLENYEKWFAYYGTDLYYPYDYKVWQYSDNGTVAGIDGPVDLNISFRMWGE